MKLRHPIMVAILAALSAVPAGAQTAPPPANNGPPPSPVPGAATSATTVSNNLRDESANYNRLIGTVGANPVAAEQAKRAARSAPVPALPADIKPGAALRDINGLAIGTVESVDGDGAVVIYAKGKVKVPLSAFGKDNLGLLLGTTAEKFLALAAKAAAGS